MNSFFGIKLKPTTTKDMERYEARLNTPIHENRATEMSQAFVDLIFANYPLEHVCSILFEVSPTEYPPKSAIIRWRKAMIKKADNIIIRGE